jgi:adenosylcobinamide-phosphate synthase
MVGRPSVLRIPVSFIALLVALALEQWRPLVDRRAVFAPVTAYAGLLERHFDAGEAQQGVVAWVLAVVPVVLISWALYAFLFTMHPLLGLAFNIAALYVTLGFRQHSHYFTDIQTALKEGDVTTARRLLGEWRGHPCDTLSPSEVARLTIEGAFIVSHRHVFGAMLWFVLLPGPTGAVLYRMALFLDHRWGQIGHAGRLGPILDPALAASAEEARFSERSDAEQGNFGMFARQAFHAIDWLPVRVTAASFAIVGDFEDAVYCWRTQAARWPDPLLGIVLAAGAGALGVRLGAPIMRSGVIEDRPELGLGEDADTPFLDSAVGLIWRALSLWLVLLLVLSVARALG